MKADYELALRDELLEELHKEEVRTASHASISAFAVDPACTIHNRWVLSQYE